MDAFLSSPKVVVIGAGIAGLTAAYRLHRQGIDVSVYEARGRVGGRIFTVKIDGQITELGGQFINDGGKAENLCHLLKELDLEMQESSIVLDQSYDTSEEFVPIQQLIRNKKFHPETLKEKLHQLVQRSKSMREVLDGLLQRNDPLYKVLTVRLAAYEGASLDDLSSWYVDTLYHMLLGGIAAAHQAGEKEELEIRRVQIKGGNALLSDKIAEKLVHRLHLNMPLAQVMKGESSGYSLFFQDGSSVQAEVLLLAIPCTVYDKIIFGPGVFPSNRLDAIKSMRYGTNAKMIVPAFKIPQRSFGFVNDRMGCFLDRYSGQLTIYYTGQASRFLRETILDTYRTERPLLEKGFGSLCPPMCAPTLAEDRSFSSYSGPVGYSWPNDPYVGGSYSYISPGQDLLLTAMQEVQGEMVKELFSPIDQRLYFAGEHTSILMDVPGTMEAACESGERAARLMQNAIYTMGECKR